MELKFIWFAVLFVTNTELEANLKPPDQRNRDNMPFCGESSVKEDFDLSRFRGTWFEIFAYPFALTAGGQCVTFTFSQLVDEKFRFMSKCSRGGMISQVMGMGEVAGPGVIALMFPAYPACSGFNTEVLDTDYDNYAVLTACNRMCSDGNGRIVWILSRKSSLEPVYVTKALKALTDNGIYLDLLTRTVQNCN